VGSRDLVCLAIAFGGKTWFLISIHTNTLSFDCPTRGKKPPGRTDCSCRWRERLHFF